MHQWLLSNGRPILGPLLSHLDTPISLSIWLMIKNKEWDQLATRWVDPQHYPEGVFSALRYRKDVQAVDLLRKAPLPTTFSRREAALQAWENAESKCKQTNEWLSRLLSSQASLDEWRHAQFLRAVQRRLGRWLGPLPEDLSGGFGPGTCFEYVGESPTLVDKLWLTPTTTPEAAPYFSVLYGRTHWGISRTQANLAFQGTSRGNRLTTVPKDGKTDRPISIEPLGNLWLQLGIGRYLKRRLRLIGLPDFGDCRREVIPGLYRSFDSAQDIHRRLAKVGCESGFATIDLSSASDTVARELVRWVLPPDWFSLLNDTRSPMTLLPKASGGKWRVLEKFSSMGNGFTFELETLIFLGLICVAFGLTPGVNCWVFGDDIIVPERYGRVTCTMLERFGFIPNLRKTYLSGPFRESCGGNFHTGIDVTPVRITSEVDEISEWISLHNNLLAWGFPFSKLRGIRERIPIKYRVFGPRRLGDVVLHSDSYPLWTEGGIRWVRTLRFVPCHTVPLGRFSPELSLTAVLLGVGERIVRRYTRMKPVLHQASVS